VRLPRILLRPCESAGATRGEEARRHFVISTISGGIIAIIINTVLPNRDIRTSKFVVLLLRFAKGDTFIGKSTKDAAGNGRRNQTQFNFFHKRLLTV
jgi:hypothetical protein